MLQQPPAFLAASQTFFAACPNRKYKRGFQAHVAPKGGDPRDHVFEGLSDGLELASRKVRTDEAVLMRPCPRLWPSRHDVVLGNINALRQHALSASEAGGFVLFAKVPCKL